jgi:hypothetical protein
MIWPTLGRGYEAALRTASFTKAGPGRRHKQGKAKH